MKDHGGFEHNRQSLRIVELLEQKYPLFPGLNLTWEVREGLAKHWTSKDRPGLRKSMQARRPSLEAQVANLGDEITYYSHDLDDGLTARLLKETKLRKDVTIWGRAARQVKRQYGDLPDECRRYFIIRCIIDDQVKDVVTATERRLTRGRIQSADQVREQARPLVQYSPERKRLNRELRQYLYENLYYNPEVHEPNRRAVLMLRELFAYFLENSRQMGENARKRIRPEGLHRAVCDYLAGMTDRYAILEHQRLFGLAL
jgi:dGTPase